VASQHDAAPCTLVSAAATYRYELRAVVTRMGWLGGHAQFVTLFEF